MCGLHENVGEDCKKDNIKYQALSFLIEQKNEKKKVIAYGAAAKGNTLLNYAGIKGNDLIQFVVDAAPSKQGKFLPGSHIPVYDESKIKETQPDFIIILPWNLKEEIMEQLSYVREWGCEFVVFIPGLQKFNPKFFIGTYAALFSSYLQVFSDEFVF